MLVRHVQDVGLFADINPCRRVERVGVRRSHALVGGRRIFRHVDEVAHRRVLAIWLGHVGEVAPGQLHCHQRVTVDVGVNGGALHVGCVRLGLRRTDRAQTNKQSTGEKAID
jgi:hypothetical protein